MVKRMRAVAYRNLERPYTRKSKYRKKSFVRAVPNNKIVRFVMGDRSSDFDYTVKLVSDADLQIRHESIESARKTCNRVMVKAAPNNYRFTIRIYPHHVLRNNPLAAGAGADRMSTGMAHSFGKPIGIAAQVNKGQTLFEIECGRNHVEAARLGLNRARQKIACGAKVVVERNEPKEQ